MNWQNFGQNLLIWEAQFDLKIRAFLMILRPFKAGDLIQAGGVLGVVDDVGLFVTTINTPDNIKTFVGNAKIFNDNIRNFSANAFRRVDLVAQLNHSVDPNKAIEPASLFRHESFDS